MNYKRLNDNAKTPTRGSDGAAGYDLYGANTYTIEIKPHKTVMIDTGLAIEVPVGLWAAILPRSGMATKRGLRPVNTPGCIDEDYRGPVIVALHNDSDEVQNVEPGERIAQMVFLPYYLVDWNEVDELSDTERGKGGFGSTGKK